MTLIKPNYFLDGVMREVATKYSIPFVKVQECMAAQFEFVRRNIENYNSKTQTGARVIYLPNFGKFIISDKGVEYVSGDIAIELYRKRYMLEKLFIGKKYGIEEVKHFCKKTLDDLGLYVVEYEVPQEDDPYTENGIGAYKRLEV